MKILDQTPLLDEKGELGFTQRIQGMLQFGFNWPIELKAQNVIVNYFDRNLEKGYTLIRNQMLGQSGIMIPMILLGPAGVLAINITYLRGRYEAKGDSWNVESGNHFKPARDNLIQKTATMARALTAFIERQGVKLPVAVEPVLIAAEPGLHIDSAQPAVKVLMSDGIRTFVAALKSGVPALRADAVLEFVERIIHPRPARVKIAPTPPPTVAPRPAREPLPPAAQPEIQNVSRARAIFNASEEAKPFDPADFDFALLEEESPLQALPPVRSEAAPVSETRRASRRALGMTPIQLAVVAAIALCLVCLLVAAFAYVIPSLS